MNVGRTALLTSVLVLGASGAYAWDHDPTLISKIDIGGKGLGTFDISFVDAKIGLYVLADRTNASVDFVSTEDNRFIGRSPQIFAGQKFKPDGKTADNTISGPDGVAIVGHTEVWAGDGDSTLKVLDAKTMQLIQTIPIIDPTNASAKMRVDEMAWDERDHILAAANNANTPPFITFVNTDTKQVIGQIVFDGKNGTPDATDTGIEQPAWSPRTGLFYVSVPQIVPGTDTASTSKGGVSVIDPKTRTVLTTYEVDNCSPAGLSIGPKEQAMVGCSASFGTPPTTTTQIIDLANGNTVVTIPIGGSDEVWFDPGTHHYYMAARNNLTAGKADPVLGSVDARDNMLDGTASTSTTAHSVAADKFQHNIYVPIGFVPPGSAAGTDPTNPCPDKGCIAVYKPAEPVIAEAHR